MYKVICASIVLFLSCQIHAQQFFQESFETETGWILSHSFDDGLEDYCKRDSAVAFDGLDYVLFGQNGSFVIGVEDSNAPEPGAPSDGIITLELDPIDITGRTDLELVVKLSCNDAEAGYDDRALINGDYLDFEVSIDGGTWETIGTFNSAAGGTSISTLFQDENMNGNGGELGETAVVAAMKDYLMTIPSTGSSLELRAIFKMDGGDEELVIDDLRLRESTGDIIAPTIYSITLIDDNTIQVIFNEAMASSAEQTFQYSGIGGLSTVTLGADLMTITLDYSTPFELGEPYSLVIFGVRDLANNPMSSAVSFDFYFNPTTPDLIIHEVMYNDPSDADSLEFVEIYNRGFANATLGGFRLEGAISHTLESVVIPPGGFYLAARNATAAEAFYGVTFNDYGGQLSDNSENIILVNATGVLLDSVSYMDDAPWPAAADGLGPSMEMVTVDLDNDIGSNWIASDQGVGFVDGVAVYATPGALPPSQLPVVEFGETQIAVHETDGVIELNLFLSGSDGSASSVEINYLEGTATSPEDHGSNSIQMIDFPDGISGQYPIAFPLVNDGLDEGLEYFTLFLTATNNAQIGANSTLTILISDDDHTDPALFINEIQSSNMNTVTDEFGEYDDWFEIFNPNIMAVDLAGFYVSDDWSNPLKDRLTVGSNETIIPPGGWMLIWADEDGGQGPLHVNFRLSSAGETVILTSPNGVNQMDQMEFGIIDTDESQARICDGESFIDSSAMPTPGSENCGFGLDENELQRLYLYPNPASDLIHFDLDLSYRIFDVLGKEFLNGTGDKVDIESIPDGLYFILSEEGFRGSFVKE